MNRPDQAQASPTNNQPPLQFTQAMTPEHAWQYMQQQLAEQKQQMERIHQENLQLHARLGVLMDEKNTNASPAPGATRKYADSEAEYHIRPSKPDTYNGSRRTPPDVWLFGLESFFKATNVTSHEQRINFAAAQLREAASTWWKRVSIMPQVPQTWSEFKEQFLRQFLPVASKETARASLHAMKQRNNVAGYCDAFTSCLLQLEDGEMSEQDQLFLFRRGLNKEIALQLNLVRPKTLPEAMATAVLIEQENRNYQRISGSSNYHKGFGPSQRHTNNHPAGYGYANSKSNGSAPMELGNLNHNHIYEVLAEESESQETTNEEGQALNAMSGRRDRLSPEQVKDYMKRGICFTCAKSGHLSRNCPSRIRPQTQQGPKKY